MKNQIVIFFEGYFKKIDVTLLLDNEIDIDFGGSMMVRFLNTNGTLTAINGIDGGGNNILSEIAFKDAELYFPQ